jgi:hypothetical protein
MKRARATSLGRAMRLGRATSLGRAMRVGRATSTGGATSLERATSTGGAMRLGRATSTGGATSAGRGTSLGRATPLARASDAAGQASVELVAMLPLLVAAALALGQLLAAGAARELAGHAAEAAAIAIGRGADARAAAREALPGWSRDRLAVKVDGRRVTATVTPLPFVPPLAERLRASVTADAGPAGGSR